MGKNRDRQMDALDNKTVRTKKRIAGASSDEDSDGDKVSKKKTKIDKMFGQKNLTVLSEHYIKMKNKESDDDDDLLVLTRQDHEVEGEAVKIQKKKSNKTQKATTVLGKGTKVWFNEDGTAYDRYAVETLESFEAGDVDAARKAFLKEVAEDMEKADAVDKSEERERRRSIKRERRMREKEVRRGEV